MGDITNMVATVEADIGETLSATSVPTQSQVVAWANSGTLLLAGLLCPNPLPGGGYTKGRVDLLMKLIESESKTDGATGLVSLPSAEDIILGWLAIQIGTSTTQYAAKITNLETVLGSQLDTIVGADSTNPICAFGDGKLVYAPKTGPDRAIYTFIEKPTAMVVSSAEDFPYSEICIPIVEEYMLYKLYSQRERNVEKAQIHLQAFTSMAVALSGLSKEAISNAVS